MAFVARGGEPSRQRYDSWIRRRSAFAPDWTERFEEFKLLRHEALYGLRPTDFSHMKRDMKEEHALGKLEVGRIDHSLSENFSPPIPFMYPFHCLFEEMGRIPKWSEVWKFLTKERPELVFWPYAATNGLEPGDPRLGTQRYLDAFQWRLGVVFYSWLRELHFMTELRCVHRIDARYHFAVDAEWKADLVAGDVLVEIYVTNTNYKNCSGEGRKETCADANPWAKTIRVGFRNQNRWGRPYFLEDQTIAQVAADMAAAGCPKLS